MCFVSGQIGVKYQYSNNGMNLNKLNADIPNITSSTPLHRIGFRWRYVLVTCVYLVIMLTSRIGSSDRPIIGKMDNGRRNFTDIVCKWEGSILDCKTFGKRKSFWFTFYNDRIDRGVSIASGESNWNGMNGLKTKTSEVGENETFHPSTVKQSEFKVQLDPASFQWTYHILYEGSFTGLCRTKINVWGRNSTDSTVSAQ